MAILDEELEPDELEVAAGLVQARDRYAKMIRTERLHVIDLAMSLRDKRIPLVVIRDAANGYLPRASSYTLIPEATIELLKFAATRLATYRKLHADTVEALAKAVYQAKVGRDGGYGATYSQIVTATGLTQSYVQQLMMRGRDGAWAFNRYIKPTESTADALRLEEVPA